MRGIDHAVAKQRAVTADVVSSVVLLKAPELGGRVGVSGIARVVCGVDDAIAGQGLRAGADVVASVILVKSPELGGGVGVGA